MSKRDYYEILGIGRDASGEEIKKQYRKLSALYHPDRNVEKSEEEKKSLEEKFKEAKEAYEHLSDPDKRQHYDRFGHGSATNFSSGSSRSHSMSQEDIQSIFETMFGGKFRFDEFGHIRPQHSPTFTITISLEDAFVGKVVQIDSSTKVNIPAGIRNGSKLFSNGKIFRIDIRPHSKFKRSNDDLLVDIEITAIEAALGLNATLEHLGGSVLQFSIPSGIQPGQVIKLSGKGMKNPETDQTGDLLVRIFVTIPKNLSDADKIALKTISHRESIII